MPLSDVKLRSLKPTGKSFKTADAEGLYVLTTGAGAKLWRMDYRFGGARKTLSFGQYPEVSLGQARLKRQEVKLKLAAGIDPGAEVKAAKETAKRTEGEGSEQTFKMVAEKWLAMHKGRWVQSYYSRIRSRIEDDAYPFLGDRPIAEITPKEVLAVIRRIESRGAVEMGRRIYQIVGNIFKFAVGEDIIASDPTRDIGKALAPPNKKKRRKAAVATDLGKVQLSIQNYQGELVTKYAMEFVMHTFVRTQEIRYTTWDEFEDLDGKEPLWRISKERMKMARDETREDHLVPLSPQALAIVRKLMAINGRKKWVFASPLLSSSKPISENTMIYALYKMGYHSKATIHGFRTTASTVLNDNEFNKDWIEMQLSHVDTSVRGIYNDALYLPQRRRMMEWWSNFLDAQLASERSKDQPHQFADLI